MMISKCKEKVPRCGAIAIIEIFRVRKAVLGIKLSHVRQLLDAKRDFKLRKANVLTILWQNCRCNVRAGAQVNL